MRRVDIPGGWADIRSPEEITQRGRRGIQAIAAGLSDALPKLKDATPETDMATLGLSEEEMDAVMRIQEATVVAFLMGWSRDEPLPTLATVGDMPATLFDALSLATAKDGAAVASITLDTSPGEGAPDPKDLSGDSALSSGLSRVESEQSLIQTPVTDIAPTSTES